jgi:hypothetical protein
MAFSAQGRVAFREGLPDCFRVVQQEAVILEFVGTLQGLPENPQFVLARKAALRGLTSLG